MSHIGISGGRCIGLLVRTASGAPQASIDQTLAGLKRLGMTVRPYAIVATPEGDVTASAGGDWIRSMRRKVLHTWHGVAPHAGRFACAPMRYVRTLGHAVLRRRAGLADFSQAVRLTADLRRDGIVHLHTVDPAAASVAEAVGRLTGMRFSMSIPNHAIDAAERSSLQRSLRAAQFTLASTDAGVQAAKALAPKAAVQRVYPGVDYRRYTPKLRCQSSSVPLMLAGGEPRADWDLAALIDASKRLAAVGHRVRCEVAGPLRDRGRTQAQIDRHGLHDSIRLVGPLSEGQWIERLARAALFVQVPSAGVEIFPNGIPSGLLEAMAMGLPAIAVRSRATEECVRHGSNGCLVSAGDGAGLFEAIHALLTRPRLGEKLGRSARETVIERFDSDVNLRTLQQLLNDAAQRSMCLGRQSANASATRVRLHQTASPLSASSRTASRSEWHHA